jgi:hypothetical protein
MPKGEFFKEPSDYEYIFSKKAKIEVINHPSNTRKEQPYIEVKKVVFLYSDSVRKFGTYMERLGK